MAGMENFYRPPGGEPRDSQPTEQFWHDQGTTGPRQGDRDPRSGDPRYGDPRYGAPWQEPGLQAHLARDRHKALRWTVGLTVAVVLAAGGVIAGMSLTGNSLPSTPAASMGSTGTSTGTGTGTGSAAGTGGTGAASQAALLDATLSAASLPDATVATTASQAAMTAGTPGAGTGAPAAGPAVRRCLRTAGAARTARVTGHRQLARTARAAIAARCGLIRRRIARFFLLHGVDGQFTIRTRSGALKTIAYERGVIQSVSNGSSIVVKAADGTIWTWDLVGSTVVRDRTGKVSQSSLTAGEPVWVGGPVISGAKDARLIFVRPPSGTS
jgi:hypothetical protein